MGSKRLEALILDAAIAGYSVKRESDGTVRLIRTKRLNKTAVCKSGLVIWPDGTAYDIQVDGSSAKGLRSYAQMREVLELPSEGADFNQVAFLVQQGWKLADGVWHDPKGEENGYCLAAAVEKALRAIQERER